MWMKDANGCLNGLPNIIGRGCAKQINTAELASHMQLWAHMGHPCGQDL